jgi:hypothetical protein
MTPMRHIEVLKYGFNKIIKEYAKFPKYLPLPCHMEHGWTAHDDALKSDLVTDKSLMFVFSRRRALAWKRASKIPVEVMGSPFMHYKNLRGFSKKKDAKGIVVFPTHSTYGLKPNYDIEDFCQRLNSLPEKYKPITICLFWIDYINIGKKYKNYGFKVVSAGAKFSNSLSFAKKFYSILSGHKYSASNEVGSYTFYAIDFKIPFFLIGEAPKVENIGNKDVNMGSSGKLTDYKVGAWATKLFSTGPIDKILDSQSKFVNDEMGVGDCLSRNEMNKVLLKYFKQNNYKKLTLIYLISLFPRWILCNSPLASLYVRIRNKLAKSS